MTSIVSSVLSTTDLTRLTTALTLISAHDTESVIAMAMPTLSKTERTAIARHSSLTHIALLIFPNSLEGLADELECQGIHVGVTTPSVIVRERLSRRYAIAAADLEIGILRAPLTDREGKPCELEIFALVTPPELAHIATDERLHGRENHFALAVADADSVVLSGLRATISVAMHPDGGGYNAHEGSTVLYFRSPDQSVPEFRRLELVCVGEFPRLLAIHQRESALGTQLLRLMTGAWATQAIATAAELQLPDHLTNTAELPQLAAAIGADQESLGRLLRYLATLGLVRIGATGDYTLTDLGALLRSDTQDSMRALALMYGGPFYQSFAALADAVRTGEDSYTKVFGDHHFAHMAANSQLAELFHQSLAASNAMFVEVTRVVDFSAARTIVDIAGGSGALLSQILVTNPTAHGILFDQPYALAAAQSRLAPLADRCTLIPGDFTKKIPSVGDIYLLSRVLHDWDDAQCHTILTTCAANMPDHAELLIIERLLPEATNVESLAVPWDIHMLCNVGGRERSETHYRRLLAEAGFELIATQPLPLDAYILRARKSC